jgi:hypothetical protein
MQIMHADAHSLLPVPHSIMNLAMTATNSGMVWLVVRSLLLA